MAAYKPHIFVVNPRRRTIKCKYCEAKKYAERPISDSDFMDFVEDFRAAHAGCLAASQSGE